MRKPTGRGRSGAYIPYALVGLFGLLVYLMRADKQSIAQIEQLALERAKMAGWNEQEKKAA